MADDAKSEQRRPGIPEKSGFDLRRRSPVGEI
jgi:hypothetical protein